MGSKLDNFGDKSFTLTRKEQAAGGRASVEARRKKKDLRLALEALLEKDFKNDDGTTSSGCEVITAKLFERAQDGDVKAFETIRSTVGQDPVQKVMVAEVEQSVIDEVEAAILDDETAGDKLSEE